MQIKVLYLMKFRDSLDSFSNTIRDAIAKSPLKVSDFSVHESQFSGDLIFILKFEGPKDNVSQEPCLLGWLTTERAESTINATLEGIAATKGSAKFFSLVSTSKSSRLLAAMIVETPDSEDIQTKAEATARNENQESPTEPKPRTKRPVRK